MEIVNDNFKNSSSNKGETPTLLLEFFYFIGNSLLHELGKVSVSDKIKKALRVSDAQRAKRRSTVVRK